MDINRANLDALFTGYNQAFRNALALSDVMYQEFTMAVPTGTAVVEFPFLEQFGGMREWIGPRHIKNIASNKLSITPRTFEDTVGVPVNDIEDDQYGVYTPIIQEMGMSAGNIQGEVSFDTLCTNDNWLDGAAFYGTTRTYGSNTISNYTTTALSATTYGAAYVAMMSYKGHGDKPLKVRPTLLLVGPALMETAKKIVENDKIVEDRPTGESTYVNSVAGPNPWYNSATLMVSPELVGTRANYWFLMATGRPVKPVVMADRQRAQLVRKDRATDDNVFFEDRIVYGTKARTEAAKAFPHLVYGGLVP